MSACRYFTTKYLSHRSTCYLRAKFLPYKARFEYQKWVHFEEASSHKKIMCRNYSVRVPFPIRILDINKLIKKSAENKIHKIKIDHVELNQFFPYIEINYLKLYTCQTWQNIYHFTLRVIMYSSNHSTLFHLILARTLGGQNSYRGKSGSSRSFIPKISLIRRLNLDFPRHERESRTKSWFPKMESMKSAATRNLFRLQLIKCILFSSSENIAWHWIHLNFRMSVQNKQQSIFVLSSPSQVTFQRGKTKTKAKVDKPEEDGNWFRNYK